MARLRAALPLLTSMVNGDMRLVMSTPRHSERLLRPAESRRLGKVSLIAMATRPVRRKRVTWSINDASYPGGALDPGRIWEQPPGMGWKRCTAEYKGFAVPVAATLDRHLSKCPGRALRPAAWAQDWRQGFVQLEPTPPREDNILRCRRDANRVQIVWRHSQETNLPNAVGADRKPSPGFNSDAMHSASVRVHGYE